jgi:hypothetical protein
VTYPLGNMPNYSVLRRRRSRAADALPKKDPRYWRRGVPLGIEFHDGTVVRCEHHPKLVGIFGLLMTLGLRHGLANLPTVPYEA